MTRFPPGLIVPPLLILVATSLGAQEPADGGGLDRGLRVFLDCDDGCDADYMQTETPWVAFVRDRADADVHVLVTRLGTGAGGMRYTAALVGLGRFAARRETVEFVSGPGEAEDLVRQGLTRAIQLGLVPFTLRTPAGSRLRLSIEDAQRDGASASAADDPWNAWVFEVGADASVEREERQNEVDIDAELGARRITERWKYGVSASGSFTRERFHLDDRVVTSTRESYSGGAVAVRSLGAHWGTGAQLSLGSSTFENTELALRVAPAVEYSVWPYTEATRRQLTLQYSLGVSSFDYREPTIFDRLSETRPTQAFVVGYDVRQPWGEADAELEAASFVDDLEQFRLVLDGGVDVRLVRGLSLELGGRASLIRDQLSIVKRDATPEEILLQRRALATDYRYDVRIGFNYTFGSIFNPVVNPRFGTGPGQILR
ncbi:MAG TPA: hypothetical protein VGE02_17275 [Gemmatimonadales bacterium]